MAEANSKRLIDIKNRLVLLAENTNKKLAARIYARLQYIPLIKYSDGNIIGFKRSTPKTKESLGFLEKLIT